MLLLWEVPTRLLGLGRLFALRGGQEVEGGGAEHRAGREVAKMADANGSEVPADGDLIVHDALGENGAMRGWVQGDERRVKTMEDMPRKGMET